MYGRPRDFPQSWRVRARIAAKQRPDCTATPPTCRDPLCARFPPNWLNWLAPRSLNSLSVWSGSCLHLMIGLFAVEADQGGRSGATGGRRRWSRNRPVLGPLTRSVRRVDRRFHTSGTARDIRSECHRGIEFARRVPVHDGHQTAKAVAYR